MKKTTEERKLRTRRIVGREPLPPEAVSNVALSIGQEGGIGRSTGAPAGLGMDNLSHYAREIFR